LRQERRETAKALRKEAFANAAGKMPQWQLAFDEMRQFVLKLE